MQNLITIPNAEDVYKSKPTTTNFFAKKVEVQTSTNSAENVNNIDGTVNKEKQSSVTISTSTEKPSNRHPSGHILVNLCQVSCYDKN